MTPDAKAPETPSDTFVANHRRRRTTIAKAIVNRLARDGVAQPIRRISAGTARIAPAP